VSDVVSARDAARAALDAASGTTPLAVITAVSADARIVRVLVHADGTVHGALPDAALHAEVVAAARAALADAAAAAHTLERAGWTILLEVFRATEQLVVVGAGHIAVPLAHLGVMLGFRVIVLDDREEFATAERFDDDVHVQRADFEHDPFAGVVIDANTYVALVTRGHRWDFDCLQRLLHLDTQPRYIGMIGSRRRVRAAFHALLEAGTPRAQLAMIRAPIGIELEAETPAEIAVSIAAELVAVRRGADIGGIGQRERVLERFLGGA